MRYDGGLITHSGLSIKAKSYCNPLSQPKNKVLKSLKESHLSVDVITNKRTVTDGYLTQHIDQNSNLQFGTLDVSSS